MKKKSAMGTVAKCPADAEPSLPNGIAFGEHGELLVANIGTGVLERTSPDGETRALYDEIEGQPIGKVNFITRASRNRLWISVSTRISPIDRKSTRLTPVTNAQLVCRLLLDKKTIYNYTSISPT